MRVVLDAMGSDTCPGPELQATLEAVQIFGDELILTGPEPELVSALKKIGKDYSLIRIVDAPDRITMQDKGLQLALKAKRRNAKNSMAVGIDMVRNGEADAFVTAGNTGGALATAFYRLGTIPGVERPGLTAVFPVKNGHCVVLDIGANPESKPMHLLQFAVMGSVYANKVRGVQNPRIGLLSIGEEPGKGNELVKETYPLLMESGLNFIGNIESKELFGGEVDVAVTDGFSGNILLKTSEAVAKLVSDILRAEIKKSIPRQLGAVLAKPAFTSLKKVLDPGEIGAVPLLGINGLVLIGHGRSDARAMLSAIGSARQAVASNLLPAIQTAIQEQLSILESKFETEIEKEIH
jgi:glycerol-3-phosphate acyltransferase PlsX